MMALLKDTAQSWFEDSDGNYTRNAGDHAFSAHKYFMTNPSLSGRGSALRATGAAVLKRLFPRVSNTNRSE